MHHLYNKALCSYIYLYTYMLAIAGKTAEPNRLTFLEETHGYPRDYKG